MTTSVEARPNAATPEAAPRPSARGLTEADAATRLAADGPNDPVIVAKQSLALKILRRFANPLVAILVVASVASAAMGDYANGGIIFAIVLLSALVEFIQTHRSVKAADALREQVAPTATVLRDGRMREVARREVVVGDVVLLSAGDMVPADATLLEAKDLHVAEAALTGESMPVERTADLSLSDSHVVLLGSSVVSGTGKAVVTATGPLTTFGSIAASLARTPPPTEFERGIVRFGIFILESVLFLVLFVFVVTAVLKREPLEALLFAVALAVGLTPEFLPMITTVTLAEGAVRMAKQKVIVKNLAALQNLGRGAASKHANRFRSGLLARSPFRALGGDRTALAARLALGATIVRPNEGGLDRERAGETRGRGGRQARPKREWRHRGCRPVGEVHDMNELKSLVSVGMTVRTLDGKAVGRVTTLHGDTFEMEKGVFFNRDYGVAFDEIARVDHREVVLSLSAEALAAMRAPGEVGTALADRAAGVFDHARTALDEAVHAGHLSPSKQD